MHKVTAHKSQWIEIARDEELLIICSYFILLIEFGYVLTPVLRAISTKTKENMSWNVIFKENHTRRNGVEFCARSVSLQLVEYKTEHVPLDSSEFPFADGDYCFCFLRWKNGFNASFHHQIRLLSSSTNDMTAKHDCCTFGCVWKYIASIMRSFNSFSLAIEIRIFASNAYTNHAAYLLPMCDRIRCIDESKSQLHKQSYFFSFSKDQRRKRRKY